MLTNGLGISKNPLNDISKVYMEKVAAKPDFLDLDKDGNKKEPMKKAAKEKKVEAPKEKLKTDRDGYRVPQKDADAARERLLAKARAKRAKMSEGLDPVGQEDADIDNDGDTDKTDKYLHNRRKAIGKAIKKKKGIKEGHCDEEGVECSDVEKKKDSKKNALRAEEKTAGSPEHKPGGSLSQYDAEGKSKAKAKLHKEGYHNWRQDLIEVMDDVEDQKEVKEKKVNNKIKINPELGEAVEELGGTLLEVVEVDEMDVLIESVYEELIEEGYTEDDVEEAIEFALTEELTEASDKYYDSAVKASKKAGAKIKRAEMVKKAKGRLRYLGRKAKEKFGSAKKKAGMASAQAQVAAYNKARETAQTAGDKARRAKKKVEDAPKKAKKGVKGLIKKAAQKVVDRMSEETLTEKPGDGYLGPTPIPNPIRMAQDAVDATNRANQKKVDMVNKTLGRGAASMPKYKTFNKGPSAASQRYLGLKNEELSIDDQMRISREYNRMSPEEKKKANKKAMGKIKKVKREKDKRTDAEKMTDATGPRKGSRYRGD
tara:strand:- start:115 stop:1740 length:1626 start_codon:yes stop_codon:yes gene_type:complete